MLLLDPKFLAGVGNLPPRLYIKQLAVHALRRGPVLLYKHHKFLLQNI